jgi:DNA-binding TFAR19-related protein (PDSD5 family)
MGDAELQALRAKRMAELQAQEVIKSTFSYESE